MNNMRQIPVQYIKEGIEPSLCLFLLIHHTVNPVLHNI